MGLVKAALKFPVREIVPGLLASVEDTDRYYV
jgi:hypothetical protein